MSVLKIKDENGNFISIPTIKGDTGPTGPTGPQGPAGPTQDISGKEDKTNKVTTLSSASTDTQYPSAKCVYDLVGDIETLLGGI